MDKPDSQSGSVVEHAPLGKCAHEGCTCTVADGEQFCSDYCAARAGTEHGSADHECQCGHAECEHVMAVPTPLSIATP